MSRREAALILGVSYEHRSDTKDRCGNPIETKPVLSTNLKEQDP
ncbi:hypothetical protein PHET_10731 [Paragonimus heterotremus]|uniref:Uncharacterized protein n=1 Tax=Paragonimus heterotremus TaxID=100268 RepID=A0A8J4STI9_9TREM|nr:hypothetical protein PHET_10731 [Paragonimus heterotremus]